MLFVLVDRYHGFNSNRQAKDDIASDSSGCGAVRSVFRTGGKLKSSLATGGFFEYSLIVFCQLFGKRGANFEGGIWGPPTMALSCWRFLR